MSSMFCRRNPLRLIIQGLLLFSLLRLNYASTDPDVEGILMLELARWILLFVWKTLVILVSQDYVRWKRTDLVRSNIGWREKRSIPYKGVETSP